MEDATVDLWAIDEVHFQQHGSRCRMWIAPETKKPIPGSGLLCFSGINILDKPNG
jgi:hypothetical protein